MTFSIGWEEAPSPKHLTFVRKAPERTGLPRHHPFETVADWMIAKMLPDHIEHFSLWPDGW